MGVTPTFWRGKRVLLTGHTGFKGSWLALWLDRLGATVTGYANGVPTTPSLYETASVGATLASVEGDIRDLAALARAVEKARPEIVIHMAAQSLVRRSYADPVETFGTNVVGTVNVFEATRSVGNVRVVLNVTSDKCYANQSWDWGYRENEALGGDDPYSASKACAELVTNAYRQSFFNRHGPAVASVRAGNVIGGGDWAADRLVPDIVRAALDRSAIVVRNPKHIRPWQHVLNPLAGYLQLVERLWSDRACGAAWNFGPADTDVRSVEWIVAQVGALWHQGIDILISSDEFGEPSEASALRLDSSRARLRLGWRPIWTLDRGLAATVAWYEGFEVGDDARRLTLDQIASYETELGCSQ